MYTSCSAELFSRRTPQRCSLGPPLDKFLGLLHNLLFPIESSEDSLWLLVHAEYIPHTFDRRAAWEPCWFQIGRVAFVDENKDIPSWVVSSHLFAIRSLPIFPPLRDLQ